MRLGYTHYEVYDRESDYWRDMDDALPKEKNSLPAPTSKEQIKNIHTDSIARNSKNITGEEK